MKLSRYSIIGIMVALLLTAMAIMPVFGAVAGTVTTDKSYVKAGGDVEVTVVDADLNISLTASDTVTATQGWVSGVTQYFSLNDSADHNGTGTFGTIAPAIGDELAGGLTVTALGSQLLALNTANAGTVSADDFILSVVNPETGKIGVLYVGTDIATQTTGIQLVLGYKIARKNSTTVLVTSPSYPDGITVTLIETTADSATYKGKFDVINGASSQNTAKIQAVAGQSVTIKYTDDDGAKRSVNVMVESTPPVGSLVSPANNSYTTDLTPTLSVDFTDSDSGVVAGTSYKFNIVSVTTTGSIASGLTTGPLVADTEAITNGYRGTYTLLASPDAETTTIKWFATATDNAGNVGRTDADPSKAGGPHDYVLTIDRQGPKFATSAAFVGRWWDEVAESVVIDATKASNTTIAIKFPDTNNVYEELDGATLIAADFRIDGLKDASGAVLSTVVPSAVTVYPKAANYAFLTVPPMASDASPTAITLTGAISDVAGNSTATGSVGSITDEIAPVLTYTLNKSLDADHVTITITSDEPLQGSAPSVTVDNGDGSLTTATVGLVATLKWEATLDPTGNGVWAVVVKGTDLPGNERVLGNSLITPDFPTSKSIVFYTDGSLPSADLVPDHGDEVTTANPFFLTIDHSAEAKEYGLDSQVPTPRLSTTTISTTANLNIATNLDTSALVTITAATLDGVDILSKFETQNSLNFTAAITDITIGDHVLVYSATDEAGNKVTGRSVTFTVTAREAYKVGMNAGWNLISLPGAAKDPSLDSVFPVAHPATDVLTFEDGVWLVATRVSGGAWEGTLTTIDEKHGYWVNTTSSQPVSTLLNLTSVGAAATLPTIEINAGWNLISVIDLAQLAQGTADNTRKPNDDGTDTDDLRVGSDYLTSVSWSVAYTYDSSNRRWNRVTPTAGLLGNGQGVWVWAIKAGTLIP